MNTPVNFELAKLLKEKGFVEFVNNYFSDNGREEHSQLNYKANYNSSVSVGLTHSRPTIAEVVMWLYEKHLVWVSVDREWIDVDTPYFYYSFGSYNSLLLQDGTGKYLSPDKAYEAAIKYVLENIL